MSVNTIFWFLLGSGDAIQRVCGSHGSLAIGAVLVLSAALARTWNRKNLRVQPWHLALPFAASIGSAFLFAIALCLFRGQSLRPFPDVFPPILRAFWLTAPLAWLYGYPFERNNSRLLATKKRLWLLGLVAAWRVILMMRVACVVAGLSGGISFMFVACYGCMVALVAMWGTLPKSSDTDRVPKVVSVMGGFSPSTLPEQQQLARTVSAALGIVFFLLTLITLPITLWNRTQLPIQINALIDSWNAVAWLFAIGSVAAFGGLAFWFQPRIRLAAKIDSLIAHENYDRAIAALGEWDRTAVPWHWQPPLDDIWRGGSPDPLFGLLTAGERTRGRDWRLDILTATFGDYLRRPILWWFDDSLAARVAQQIKFYQPDAVTAVGTLSAIDSLTRSLRWFQITEKEIEDSHPEDERSLGSTFPPEIIRELPEMTDARRSIVDRLQQLAGDAYTPPATEDFDE